MVALNQSNLFAYGCAGIAVFGLLAIMSRITGSLGIAEFFGGIAAGLGALGAILFYRYGYIFVPIVTGQAKISSSLSSTYEIPPSQDVILKKGDNGMYYATMFLGIKIYESVSEKSHEGITTYNEFFERAISNLKYVTKISYLLYVEDVTEKRKIIETKRAEAQLRLARERDKSDSDVLKIDRYERESSKWDNELQKIIKGIKPMGVVASAMTTATGITSESAIAAVRGQTQEIKAILTNALNVEIETLTADQMLRAFEWEKMIPSSPQELENSVN